MNNNPCDTCLAHCCTNPIISGPRVNAERFLDWIIEGDGDFKKEDSIENFLNTMRMHILESIKIPDFFGKTQNTTRALVFDKIVLHHTKKENGVEYSFSYEVLFKCPELNPVTNKCNDYDDRPPECRNFECSKTDKSAIEYDTLVEYKTQKKGEIFDGITGVLERVRAIILNK